MNKSDYIGIVKRVADSKLDYINAHGHAKAGHNGPYMNRETPVRNTAHWLVTFLFLYRKTNEKKYQEVARLLADYLVDEGNYGKSGAVIARTDYRFDKTNGLIGQAWVIEALVEASKEFHNQKYLEKARSIFYTQRFVEEKSMWDVVDVDGSICYDIIFNHQLWFAASGSLLLDVEFDSKIHKMITLFLNASAESLFHVHDNGLIVHRCNYTFTRSEQKLNKRITKKRKLTSLIRNPYDVLLKKIHDKKLKYPFGLGVEEGYHIFDMYGFALLYNNFKDHKIFKCEQFIKALEYTCCEDNVLDLTKPCGEHDFNKFGFGYNSPAYELPFVTQKFKKLNGSLCDDLFQFQMKRIFDNSVNSFINGCTDSETMDARIYELTRVL